METKDCLKEGSDVNADISKMLFHDKRQQPITGG